MKSESLYADGYSFTKVLLCSVKILFWKQYDNSYVHIKFICVPKPVMPVIPLCYLKVAMTLLLTLPMLQLHHSPSNLIFWQRVKGSRVSVSIFRNHMFNNFSKFSLHVASDCGLFILWQHCNMCSSFVDDVTFSYTDIFLWWHDVNSYKSNKILGLLCWAVWRSRVHWQAVWSCIYCLNCVV